MWLCRPAHRRRLVHPSDSTGRSVDARNPACRRSAVAGSRFASPAARRRALRSAVAYLRCTVCAGAVQLRGRQLICGSEHRFDIARQGYVNLTTGQGGAGTGDTAMMVVARDRFLSLGRSQPVAASVRSLAAQCDHGGHGLVVNLAGGTGYYLAKTWTHCRARHGVCIDLSAPALRRAARDTSPRGGHRRGCLAAPSRSPQIRLRPC